MAKSGKVGTTGAKKMRSESAMAMVKDKRHALSNVEAKEFLSYERRARKKKQKGKKEARRNQDSNRAPKAKPSRHHLHRCCCCCHTASGTSSSAPIPGAGSAVLGRRLGPLGTACALTPLRGFPLIAGDTCAVTESERMGILPPPDWLTSMAIGGLASGPAYRLADMLIRCAGGERERRPGG